MVVLDDAGGVYPDVASFRARVAVMASCMTRDMAEKGMSRLRWVNVLVLVVNWVAASSGGPQ
jgi:hypothetical protein